MSKPAILHMFTPGGNMSPFDINMAIDAGFGHVPTYGHVALTDVIGLTQDAIFSRGPKGVARTGIFIGGREIDVADDMLRAAQDAMTPPFLVSLFADPSGGYTTAAGAVAALERALAESDGLSGKHLLVLGSGPVGAASAVLAARAGAHVRLGSHHSRDTSAVVVAMLERRFGVTVEPVFSAAEQLPALLADTEVLLSAAKAGIQVVSRDDLAAAKRLLAAVDLNAVPPAGIEGLGVLDDRKPLAAGSGQAVGIGALAVGQVKYQTQRRLFEQMLSASPAYFDLVAAFEMARMVCRE